MSHEYLIASLPELRLGERSPQAGEDFAAACENLLSEDEQRELRALLAGRPADGHSDFARRWHAFDTALRNQLARLRAQRLDAEVRGALHEGEYDSAAEHLAHEAMNERDPQRRELLLDQGRFDRLDELVGTDRFTLAGVLAFAARLRLVERWAAMDADTGTGRLEALLDTLVASTGDETP